MKVLFWLYKSRINKKGFSPLYVRVTIGGERIEIDTRILLKESSWDQVKQHVKGNSELSQRYNSLIQTYKNVAFTYYENSLKCQAPIVPEDLKLFLINKGTSSKSLKEAFDYQINNLKARVGLDIAPNTVKKYETCRRKLLDFLSGEKGREDIFLNELSGKFIFELDAFLRIKRRLKHNAVVKNMQQLKRVVKVAIQNEWLNQDPFSGYSTAPKETDRGFLTEEELRSLEALVLPSERLERVSDIFIFCCYTGLAYADVSKLSKSHLIKGVDGNTWIILSRTKSKTQATIPVLPKALTIIEKYAPYLSGRSQRVIITLNIQSKPE